MMTARFRELARKRLNEEGRDVDDPDALGLAVARERKVWTRTRLTDLGVERAAYWGWPNIYTYTKSLGEQLVAAETGMVRSIVRPSIVESALSYPFPGWNEGFTTTAPIIFLIRKGQTQIPANRETDSRYHAGGPGRVGDACGRGAGLRRRAATCFPGSDWRFQCRTTWNGSSVLLDSISEALRGEGHRRQDSEPASLREWSHGRSRLEIRKDFDADVQCDREESVVAARSRATAWGGGRVAEVIDLVKNSVERVEELTRETTEAFDMFRPFTVENAYVFRSDNVRSLFERISEDEQIATDLEPGKV